MENSYAYATSYPDSTQSSPRSREVDFDSSTATWDDPTAHIIPPPPPSSTTTNNNNNKTVKLMCSYGGKIQPRPHDNQLAYTGGETKILVVDRGIKFINLIGRLGGICGVGGGDEVCFKYQLPGEDLDALISVTNDDDLDNLMHEYDRLCRLSSKPARLRLFLFPTQTPSVTPSNSFGSSERERLVEALNSTPPQAAPPRPPVAMSPANNVDFLFGTDNGVANNQVQQVAPVIHDDPIQRHIQDLKRLQIVGQGEGVHRRNSDDNLSGGFSGEFYTQKVTENLPQGKMVGGSVPGNLPGPGGMYQTTGPPPEQAVYMMPTQTGMYHVPMGRAPVPGPPNQGYYAVQQMSPEFYRDQQQQYGMITQVGTQAMGGPPGYSERFGIARSNANPGLGMVDPAYARMYDNSMGRQVYYNTPGGVVAAQYPGGAVTNQEGSKIVKSTPGPV